MMQIGFGRTGEQQFGRTLDKAHWISDDPAPNLKLEYIDKEGHALKPKEVPISSTPFATISLDPLFRSPKKH